MRMLLLFILLAAAAPLAAQTQTIPVDYSLGAGDVIGIEVQGENDLTRHGVRIDADGTFEYPYLGRVDAKGKTKRDLQDEIRNKLIAGDVVLRPQVTVEVEAMRQRYIKVTGEVRQPGRIPMNPGMTLLEALLAAGGVGPNAGTRGVIARVDSAPDGTPSVGPAVTIPFSITEIQNLTTNIDLKDDDTISVFKAEKFYVSGQVKSPGEQIWEPNLTVRSALLKAGGISEKGSSRRIKIIRLENGKEKKIDVDNTTIVQPGDTIEVGQKLL